MAYMDVHDSRTDRWMRAVSPATLCRRLYGPRATLRGIGRTSDGAHAWEVVRDGEAVSVLSTMDPGCASDGDVPHSSGHRRRTPEPPQVGYMLWIDDGKVITQEVRFFKRDSEAVAWAEAEAARHAGAAMRLQTGSCGRIPALDDVRTVWTSTDGIMKREEDDERCREAVKR